MLVANNPGRMAKYNKGLQVGDDALAREALGQPLAIGKLSAFSLILPPQTLRNPPRIGATIKAESMMFKIRTTKFISQCHPIDPQLGEREIKRRTIQQTACSVLLIGAALVGADCRAANSSSVDVPISANALTYAP